MHNQDITPNTSKKRMIRIGALVHQNKHTINDVVSILEREFPMYLKESHQSIISHSKNPKYNNLSQLIQEDAKTGILSFSH